MPDPDPPVGTDSYIAFQPDAFQDAYPDPNVAFQTFDPLVVISSPSVAVYPLLILYAGPLMRTYARGDTIVFECKVYDPTQNPPVLVSPLSGVFVTVYDPNDTLYLTNEPMFEVSVGLFRLLHQTLITDLLGPYMFYIIAVSGFGLDTFNSKTLHMESFNLQENYA